MSKPQSPTKKKVKEIIADIVIEKATRRAMVLEIAIILMTTIGAAMTIINAVSGYWALFYSTLGLTCLGGVGCVLGFFNAKRPRTVLHRILSWGSMAILVALSGVYLFLAESSAFVIWVAFLPFMFFSFYGFYPGLFLSAGVLALSLIAFYSPANEALHIALTSEMRMMFLSILAITILVGIALATLTATISNRLTELAIEYRRIAAYDALTGIHSHAFLVRWFDQHRDALIPGDHLALYFIDVDNLKIINDKYGHLAGNEALMGVANALSDEEHDLLVRWGGDEFLIIDINATRAETVEVGERLRKKVAEIKLPEFDDFPVTVSIGISYHEVDENISLDNVIREADVQLARSKHLGKNRVSIQDQE